MEVDSATQEEETFYLNNTYDLQLIHATQPIFNKVQSQNKSQVGNTASFYKSQTEIKSTYRKIVGEYCTIVRDLILDLDDDEPSEEHTLERNRLVTMEQLLSLAGVIFFQMDAKANPACHLAAWGHYCYKDIISEMLGDLESFGGAGTNHLQVFLLCLSTARVEDARGMVRVLRGKLKKNKTALMQCFNALDQILLQFNVILSDPASYAQRMEQFQNNHVIPALAKIKTEVGSTPDINESFPVIALQIISGKVDESLVTKYTDLADEATQFITPWFFTLVAEILFNRPSTKLNDLPKQAEAQVLAGNKTKNYAALEILVLRLLSCDPASFIDTFCDYNGNWWLALQILDLLYHSDVIMVDAPHGKDFFEKRKAVALDLAQTLSNKPANLKVCIDYIIACSNDDAEIIQLVRDMMNSPQLSTDLPETSRIRVYHTLLNYKMLPKQLAEEYAMSIGQRVEDPAIGLQWSIRSNDLKQLETQIVDSCLASAKNFQELQKQCEQFNGIHFQRHTLNTKIVEMVLKYNNTKRRSSLIEILSSTSSELTLTIKLDILKELNRLLYDGDSRSTTNIDILDTGSILEVPRGSNLSKAECLSLMRILERLQRQEQLSYNDLFTKFKRQLMSSYATALTAT